LRRSSGSKSADEVRKLSAEIKALNRKRDRVLDLFSDGVIEKAELSSRLFPITEGKRVAEAALSRTEQCPVLDLEKLIAAFAPFAEWEFWTREQKRQVLATLTPDIRVAEYKVESLGLNPSLFSDEDTRSHVDSSTTSRASACGRAHDPAVRDQDLRASA
jgi:hypothetical protein